MDENNPLSEQNEIPLGHNCTNGVVYFKTNFKVEICSALFFLYRKNLFMKEKLNKKEQHKLYTLFTIYRSNIVGKTNQFKHNSLFINLFCLQYYLSQWSWPKIDTLLLRI